MFLIHPIFESVGILIALYVMKLGISRFRMVHLKRKTRFNWKGHVRFGIITTTIWLIGLFGGLYIVKTSWYGLFITGLHAKIGLLMIPFILFAIGSGLYMDRKKKKRTTLPLIHAIFNTVMLFLALLQIYTGIDVYRTYVLGF
ncbi:MAG: DUF4079 domain-containing protein [Thermodesulfobacteriota bacterium]|nr:DUF4079 domain-containing protein [Thermodesulfobacteriota bacterium]